MTVSLRPGRPEDAQECGRICFEAFSAIADQHNFARDIPSVEIATGLASYLLGHPGIFSVVAERDGAIGGRRSPGSGRSPSIQRPRIGASGGA
jgi:hypothetical protein